MKYAKALTVVAAVLALVSLVIAVIAEAWSTVIIGGLILCVAAAVWISMSLGRARPPKR